MNIDTLIHDLKNLRYLGYKEISFQNIGANTEIFFDIKDRDIEDEVVLIDVDEYILDEEER